MRIFILQLKLLFWLIAFGVFQLKAQTTIVNYCSSLPAATQSNLYGPMYTVATANATNRIAVIYPASQLGSIAGNTLTNVYFHTGAGHTVGMLGTPNVKIYFKEVTPLDWGTGSLTWATEITGATLVFDGNPAPIVGTGGGWKNFPLSTNFPYSGTQNLALFIEYNNPTASNAINWSYEYTSPCVSGSTSGNETKYSNNTSGTLPATLASTNSRRPYIGFDMPCIAPPNAGTATVNNAITCGGQNITLNLSGSSMGAGQTFQWQSGSSATGPWTNVGTAQTVANITIPALVGTTYYQCLLTCGTATVASAPVAVTGLTPMAGNTYTINSAQPTSGTNFNNFSNAAAALSCGITGPVTFNVVANSGPYNEYVDFGDIPGTSSTNTITINGNGNTISYSTTTSERQIFRINGTKHLTIDSLNIVPTGTTFGWGAIIYGGASHITIKNCTFDLSANPSTTAANSAGIAFSGSLTSATTAGNAKHCLIKNNTFTGPAGAGGMNYGISLTGGADSNIVENNKFLDFYTYGIYISGAKHNLISKNEMARPTKTSVATFYGVYTTGAVEGTRIENNRIHTSGGTVPNASNTAYGIYCLGTATAAAPCIVANNAIYKMNTGGTSYGIYLSSGTNTKILHNTVVYDQVQTGTSAQAGMWLAGTNTGSEIVNNNISFTGGNTGIKYGVNYSTAVSLSSLANVQRNNIYVNSTQTGAQWYAASPTATTYADLAAFQAANPTLEVGSPSVDPQFTAPLTGDLMPGNSALLGTGINVLTDVPTDILGTPRTIAPTPGAFEMPVVSGANGGVVSLISPTGLFCSGNQNIRVSIGNFGSTPLTGFQVHWQVNGINQTPFSYTGTLDVLGGTGQFIDTISLGNISITAANTTIKAWTVITNDVDNTNDSTEVSVSPTLFTINTLSDTVCSGSILSMNLSPASGYTTGMIQWESSMNGTTFSPIANSDQPSWTVNGLTANTWYRVNINDGNITCNSNIKAIVVNLPVVTATTPGERCGAGTVQLGATANLGNNINWYDAPTGGNLLGTGTNFTTPSITTTTNYYAQPGAGNTINVPSANIGTSLYWNTAVGWGLRFTANETVTIDSITIKAQQSTSPGTASIQILVTDLTDAILYSGTVYTFPITATATEYRIPVNITVPPGDYKMVKSLTSTTSGINNMVRESSGVSFPYTSSGNEVVITAGANGAGTAQTTSAYYWFYNWKITKGCQGARVPVAATIKTTPTVTLGMDTAICTGNSLVLDAGNPGSTYLWNDNATTQTKIVTTGGQYSVTVTAANSCTTADTINITIDPIPTVNLGNDTTICAGDNLILDAGNAGATYAWDNSSTGQTRTVNATGTYYVQAYFNQNCKAYDTVLVTVSPLPLVDLGADTVLCNGTILTLDAGNPGASYLWDNTTTLQTRDVNAAGQYYVTVTDGNYCTASDTINISIVAPPNGTFTATEGPNGAFTFEASGNNIDTYSWNFGDGNTNTGNPVDHTYDQNGNYTVTLTITNECGESVEIIRSITVITAVGIHNIIDDKSIIVYPNPASNQLSIESKGTRTIEYIAIIDALGREVKRAEMYNAKKAAIDLSQLSAGMYNISIHTEDGKVIRKFTIVK
ncbi:MAG: right-handed parallel beta-helix repeat-containing protein [Taibaiella sp.]|nr:right-handed parallel beta-helix repeat-containing protein [Taibaiella sp.]